MLRFGLLLSLAVFTEGQGCSIGSGSMCQSCTSGGGSCASCNAGYILSGAACEPCPQACSQCSASVCSDLPDTDCYRYGNWVLTVGWEGSVNIPLVATGPFFVTSPEFFAQRNLTFDSATGLFSGTPTAAGASFVQVTNSSGFTCNIAVRICASGFLGTMCSCPVSGDPLLTLNPFNPDLASSSRGVVSSSLMEVDVVLEPNAMTPVFSLDVCSTDALLPWTGAYNQDCQIVYSLKIQYPKCDLTVTTTQSGTMASVSGSMAVAATIPLVPFDGKQEYRSVQNQLSWYFSLPIQLELSQTHFYTNSTRNCDVDADCNAFHCDLTSHSCECNAAVSGWDGPNCESDVQDPSWTCSDVFVSFAHDPTSSFALESQSLTGNLPTATDNNGVPLTIVGSLSGPSSATLNATNLFTERFPWWPFSGPASSWTRQVSYTATDANHNSAGCVVTIHFADTGAPTVSCPGSLVTNLPGVAQSRITAVSCVDNTPGCDVSASPNPTSITTDGKYTVTYTAMDSSGNTNTCPSDILLDTVAPVITCATTLLVNTNIDSDSYSLVLNDIDVSSPPADANSASLVGIIVNTEGWAPGVKLALNLEGSRTFTSTFSQGDEAGNVGSCVSSITVTDNQAPTVTCTAILAQDVGADSSTVVFVAAPSLDNVGVRNLFVASVAPISGPNGLASPLSPSSDLHYNATGGARAGGFLTLGVGMWNVTFTAEDYNSNKATCFSQVTITDTQAPDPTAICVAIPSTMVLGSGNTVAFSTPNVSPSDNQPASAPLMLSYAIVHTGPDTSIPSASLVEGGAIPWGSNQISVHATDASGNTATCSQVVLVQDRTAPTMHVSGYATTIRFSVAESEQTVELAYNLTAITQLSGEAKSMGLVTWDNVQLGQVTGNATTFPIGTTPLLLTVTDCAACSGLVGTYVVLIEVVDAVRPVVTCPVSRNISADPNQAFAVMDWTITATDNNQVMQLVIAEDYLNPLTVNAANFAQSPTNYRIGQHTFVVTAVDSSLNSDTCTFVLTVLPTCGDALVTSTEECDGGEGCNACVCDSAQHYLPTADHALAKDEVASFLAPVQHSNPILVTSGSEFSIVIGPTTPPPTSLTVRVGSQDVFSLGFALEDDAIVVVQASAGCAVTVFVNGDQVGYTRVLADCSSLSLNNDLSVIADVPFASLRVFRRALTEDEVDTLANTELDPPRARACARRTDASLPCAAVDDMTLCANFTADFAATAPIPTPNCFAPDTNQAFYANANFVNSAYGVVTLCNLPNRPTLFHVDFSTSSPSFSTLTGCASGIVARTYDVPTNCWQFPVCTSGYYTTGIAAAECSSYIACDSDTLYASVTGGNTVGVGFNYDQSLVVTTLPAINMATMTGVGSVPAGISPVNNSYGSGSIFHVGTYSVMFQAGNATKVDQCAVNVVILDRTSPALICEDRWVGTDAGLRTSMVVPPVLTACNEDYSTCAYTDFCPGADCTQWISSSTPFVFSFGNTSVRWRGIDEAGNEGSCTAVLSVRDMEKPVVTSNYPTNIAAPANSVCANVSLQLNHAGTSYTVTDNVDLAGVLSCEWSVDEVPSAGTVCLPILPPLTTYGVKLTCTDQSGNAGTHSYDLQVADVTPPSCVALPDVQINSSATSLSALDLQTQVLSAVGLAGWTDNNPDAVAVFVPLPSAAPVPSSRLYSYSVSDGYSTTACQIRVSVVDVGKPNVLCENEVVNPVGDSYISASPLVVDNSGESLVPVFSKSGSSHYELGPNAVTWTAEDSSGNVGTCTSTVTVADSTPPTITCPSDVVILSSTRAGSCVAGAFPSGCCLARSSTTPLAFPWSNPIVTDNYQWALPTVSSVQADLCVTRNSTQITYTATDAAGNLASCNFAVTLRDDSPPAFSSCPSSAVDLTLPATTIDGTITYSWNLVASDELQANPSLGEVRIDGVVQSFLSLAGSRALAYGDHTFEFQISDATQISVCSYHVVVLDVTAPVLTCPLHQLIRSLSSDSHVDFDPIRDYTLDVEPDNSGRGTGLVKYDNSFMLNAPAYQTFFPYLGRGQSTATTISVSDAANNLQTCNYQVTVLPRLASAAVDGALSKVTLNRRQDDALYASLEFLTSAPWPWVLAVPTQTDPKIHNVQISAPNDCPAVEFSTPRDSCRQQFSAVADLPSCSGDIVIAVKVMADCDTHGPNAHVGACSSQEFTLVITLSLGSSDTSSLCLSHNVSTVPITTSLVALSDAQYAQFVSTGSAPLTNNIFYVDDYVNMVAQVESVVNTSKVSVVSARREYCALVCSGNNAVATTDLVTNGAVAAVVEHAENNTKYSVVRFLSNDIPPNTAYYTVLHAVIRIEYWIAGGQRRSTVVQASVSQQAQAQATGFLLQRGRIDTVMTPDHSVEISVVLMGDMRPILATTACAEEWKQMASNAMASKLALLLGEPATRFVINVNTIQTEGAAIMIGISPLNGQPDTVLAARVQDLVQNSANSFTIRVPACHQQILTTLSPDVFFMRNAGSSASVPSVATSRRAFPVGVVGAAVGGGVVCMLLVFLVVWFRLGKGPKKTEQVAVETRQGSGGIVYSSVHLETPDALENNKGPTIQPAVREMV